LIKFDDGAIGLVLIDEEIALLKFSDGSDWLNWIIFLKKILKKENTKS